TITMPLRLGQFAQSIIRRRMRHTHEIDKAGATEQPASSTAALIFESLEPRLLLAADPLGISAGYAFNETSGTTTPDPYALTLDQIQTDMVTPLAARSGTETAAPTAAITAPTGGATVSGTVTLPQAALDHMSETVKAQLAERVRWLISTDQSISSITETLAQ